MLILDFATQFSIHNCYSHRSNDMLVLYYHFGEHNLPSLVLSGIVNRVFSVANDSYT